MPPTDVLYLEGDACSPKYVAGALERAGLRVERVVDEPLDRDVAGASAVLLSDYPADLLGAAGMRRLADAVAGGVGLVVVGGWTSLGRGGYAGTQVADVLPVEIEDGDDRVNLSAGAFLLPAREHPLLDGLLFQPPPVVTGYNRVTPRATGEVVLEARAVAEVRDGTARLRPDAAPVLVLGEHGRGRVAVLATDLAPHWSGGWTDWDAARVPVGEGEELGDAYVAFVSRLAAWAITPATSRRRPPSAPRAPRW